MMFRSTVCLEEIIVVFGHITYRWYLVKWAGYDESEWERGRLLEKDGCADSIRSFWDKSGLMPSVTDYPDPHGRHRCPVCAKTYKRAQDLKTHKTRERHHEVNKVAVTATAQRDARQTKMETMQSLLPKVRWGDNEADNCWQFRYLGSIFEAGGSQLADVERRINLAVARFGKMRHIWKSSDLHMRLRMRLYISSVCSILTYGSETWNLTNEVRRKLNGVNSRMVSIITGKTPHEEASDGTRSFDLVRAVRARRLSWLGHILRMDQDRLLVKAVKHLYEDGNEGDILMDAPTTSSWDELLKWAADRKKWRMRVYKVRSGSSTTVSMQSLFVPEQEFAFTTS